MTTCCSEQTATHSLRFGTYHQAVFASAGFAANPEPDVAGDLSRRDRQAFGLAPLLYIVAKGAELTDHQLLAVFDVISGHTLKHLLASGAAMVLIARLVQRSRL